ncbi:MAG TPA: zf-HC2 domain-containing protein [Acidimicrobiales bacterium]|nr:zf-HC2 domain-containing protein [Acidimicrobiales bacterium]
MLCSDCQEALSAGSDGELSELEQQLVAAHVGSCTACHEFSERIERLNRSMRVRPAERVPDLTAAVMAAAEPVRGAVRPSRDWVRYVLVWVGLVQVALAAPPLFGSVAGTSVHVAREVGSFDLAIGVGLLVVAWQPRRVSGLLPMVTALVGALAITATLDVVTGRVSFAAESPHVLDLIGLAALWLLARSMTDRRAKPGRLLTA